MPIPEPARAPSASPIPPAPAPPQFQTASHRTTFAPKVVLPALLVLGILLVFCGFYPISLYTTPLSHKLPRELDACGEVDDALHAQPDGFDTRLPVPLTRQKASQAGH